MSFLVYFFSTFQLSNMTRETRTAVGTLLNPLAVLKARYEVSTAVLLLDFSSQKSFFQSDLYAYRNFWQAFWSLTRCGPSHLFRGAAASAMRDAPYAGLFLVSYEQLKRESGAFHPNDKIDCLKF